MRRGFNFYNVLIDLDAGTFDERESSDLTVYYADSQDGVDASRPMPDCDLIYFNHYLELPADESIPLSGSFSEFTLFADP